MEIKFSNKHFALFITIFMLVGLYGCAHKAFKYQWWHYYERGILYAEADRLEDAKSDFLNALKRRDQEKQSPRMYGRHWFRSGSSDFLSQGFGYFPRRELGIIFYRQNLFSRAIRELELSYKNNPTTRAAVYLNRARKEWIKQQKSDKSRPFFEKLYVNGTEAGKGIIVHTNRKKVVVRGAISDDTFVSMVKVNNKSLPMRISTKKFNFHTLVSLKNGLNAIPVTAIDLSGKESHLNINIYVDRIGPVISTDGIKQEPSGKYFDIWIADNVGIGEIIINGKNTFYHGSKEISIRIKASENNKNISIRAKDLAGNVTVMNYPLEKVVVKKECFVAENNLKSEVPDFNFSICMNKKITKKGFIDRERPVIHLSGFDNSRDTFVSYMTDIVVEGRVTDNDKVDELFFNGQKIHLWGKENAFSGIFSLNRDPNLPNLLIISAFDRAGNQARRQLYIYRKIPKPLKFEERLKILVGDFATDNKIDVNFFSEYLSIVMSKQKRFYPVSNYEKRRPDYILKGRIFPQRHWAEVVAGLYVKNETGEYDFLKLRVDAYLEKECFLKKSEIKNDVLTELVKRLHYRLAQELPLVEGYVIKRLDKKTIVTDIKADTGIKKGMDLIVYNFTQDKEQDAIVAGLANINLVTADNTSALLTKVKKDDIKKGYMVITR